MLARVAAKWNGNLIKLACNLDVLIRLGFGFESYLGDFLIVVNVVAWFNWVSPSSNVEEIALYQKSSEQIDLSQDPLWQV